VQLQVATFVGFLSVFALCLFVCAPQVCQDAHISAHIAVAKAVAYCTAMLQLHMQMPFAASLCWKHTANIRLTGKYNTHRMHHTMPAAVSDMFYRDTFNFSAAVDNCKRTWSVTPRSKSWPVTQVNSSSSSFFVARVSSGGCLQGV
jgi:hypothetical protein